MFNEFCKNECIFAAISKQICPEVWNDEVIRKWLDNDYRSASQILKCFKLSVYKYMRTLNVLGIIKVQTHCTHLLFPEHPNDQCFRL